jgi:hypothetical protein
MLRAWGNVAPESKMGTDDRLANILARQTVAADKARSDESNADAAAASAAQVRAQVAQKWGEHRPHLEAFINELNQQFRHNNIRLTVKDSRYKTSTPAVDVDRMEIGFDELSEMRKLVIMVHGNGQIHVSIATSSMSPAQQYELNVFEMTNKQLEGTVVDFLDLNTPK